jgi:NAD(P)-dependent dehydrogenase (short-subunit alcohol dehydrogenase family)
VTDAARSVVVTGGTTRLGKAVADALERVGWRVVRTSHRADAGADVVADLSREGGADALFASAVALLGRAPDALVNNAALFAGGDEELEAVNLRAPLRLMELMAECAGAVVNVLDCRVTCEGFVPKDAYERTKRELFVRTRSPKRGARVNGVAPGPVLVPVAVREKAGECPLGRPTAESVAAAVAYLLSAAHTTGCVIPVDGGQGLLLQTSPSGQ